MFEQPIDQHWFITLNGKRYGPYTFAALTEAAARGVIDSDTMVWRLGWVNWHPARRVPGLLDEPDDQPAEQQASEDYRAEQRSAEERSAEEHPAEEQPVEAVPANGRMVEEQTIAELTVGEHAAVGSGAAKQAVEKQGTAERSAAERSAAKLRAAERRAARLRAAERRVAELRALNEAVEAEATEHEPAKQGAAENTVTEHQPPEHHDVAKFVAAEGEPDKLDATGHGTAQDWPSEPVAAVNSRAKVSEVAPQRAAANGAADLDDAWRSFFEDSPSRSHQGRRRRDDEEAPVEIPERRDTAQPLQRGEEPGEDVLPAGFNPEEMPAEGPLESIPTVRPPIRSVSPRRAVEPVRSLGTGVALAAAMILLLAGVGWGLFATGLIVVVEPQPSVRAVEPASRVVRSSPAPEARQQSQSEAGVDSTPLVRAADNLPEPVAAMPAVAALKRNHPAVYDRFVKRFLESASNAPNDQLASLARSTLRKSVKRLLANAPADMLLEITETYLGYMQALQFTSPESCVALSDESKGASLTANLAKEFPSLFGRDMAIIARIAAADQNTTVAPLTSERAQPYLERVFNRLRQQQVQSDLLGRSKLAPTEFQPYCTLVIAFYESVLALPQDDRVNVLRYLYAAAADTDDGG